MFKRIGTLRISLKKGKKFAVTPELPITKGALTWLIACLVLVTTWHIPHTPLWALAAVIVIAAWRLKMVARGNPMPSKILRLSLTGAAFVGVLLTYRSYLGRDPGITALILLSTLKLLELKSQRDFMFIVFLCYFLILGNFLYTQTIPALIFMAAAVILVTAALMRLNRQDEEKVKISAMLKPAGKLFLLGLPFMAILFVLFPRTSGPLWNLPQDPEGRFRSGFNDYMYPGQIARLADSKAPAFRVTFPDNNMPAAKDLYFRGAVLWFTNGRAWYQGILPYRYVRRSEIPLLEGNEIRQEIIMEPHFRRWIFGLDMPVIAPRWARILPGRVFRTWRVVERYIRYEMVSRTAYRSGEELVGTYRRWSLQLPGNLNPRITELARSWKEQSASTEQLVQATLDYFTDQSFVYTQKPGTMDNEDPYTDFLFNKRRGFCEHFAGATSILLRAAGIPCRVVTGYQGGVYNPVGDFLLVRQSDAHAWCEVWFEGEGWRRIDPTAVVSPERVEYGLDVSRTLEDMGTDSGDNRSDALQKALKKNFFKRVWEALENYWDSINNKWNLWITSYDLYQQRSFLGKLGFQDFDWLTMIMVIVVLLAILFLIAAYLLRRKGAPSHPLLELYGKFCKKMAAKGVERHPWEGPLDYKNRCSTAFPGKTDDICHIVDLYIHLRYLQATPSPHDLKELKNRIRKFRPI